MRNLGTAVFILMISLPSFGWSQLRGSLSLADLEVYRGASKDLISKVVAEAQARKFLVDVAESSLPLLMIMRSMNLLTPFYVPHLAKYLAEAKEETGKGSVYWATDRESYMGFGYNRDKIPAGTVPQNYE